MVATFGIRIDPRPASAGARTVKRDLNDIKRRSRDVERGTTRMGRTAGQSFNRMARGSRQATQGVNAMAGAMQRAQGIFAAFLGVAAVRGFIRSLQQTVTELDSIAKAADRLGVGVEPLQELRFAAEQSGIAVSTFDMAMQRFTRRTAEAANGTGEAKDALAELDIQLRTSTGALRPAEDLLLDVADALAGVEDQGERVRLGFKLFDSEGVKMIQMLQEGSENLRIMRGEARALGIVLSEDLVRDAERMKDEMGRQFAALDSLWSKFVIRFLRGADRLFGFIPPTIEDQLRERVNELRSIQDALAAGPGVMRGPLDTGGTAGLEKRQSELLGEIRTLEELRQAQEGVNRALREAENIGELGAPGAAVTPRAEGVSRLADEMERVKTGADELRDVGARAFEGIGDAAERAAEDTTQFWRNTTSGISNDLLSALRSGETGWRTYAQIALNALNSIVDKLLNDVLDALFQVNRAAAGSGGGGGILGGLLGLLGGGGGGPSLAAVSAAVAGGGGLYAKGGVFSGGNELTAFARGGIVRSPTLFPMARGADLMGEAGPEAVMPLSRTRSGDLGVRVEGERDGGGNVFNIDARGATAESIAELKRALFEAAGPGKVELRTRGELARLQGRGHRYGRGL